MHVFSSAAPLAGPALNAARDECPQTCGLEFADSILHAVFTNWHVSWETFPVSSQDGVD